MASRWLLLLQGRLLRFLMSIGMYLHKLTSPRPPPPSLTRHIRPGLSRGSSPGLIPICIYLPATHATRRRDGFRSVRSGAGYPCLINYHGGGFTLGAATDDERWIARAVRELDCVVLSVAYRLAPEHPFPTAVDDAADAVLWAVDHAAELGIDPGCILLSGFSSGANLALTAPVRLHDHARAIDRSHDLLLLSGSSSSASSSSTTLAADELKSPRLTVSPLAPDASSSTASLFSSSSTPLKDPHAADTAAPTTTTTTTAAAAVLPASLPPYKIRALIPFYPSTDYTLTRPARRATNPNPALDLPTWMTRLFDDSYLPPRPSALLAHPWLSPGRLGAEDMRAVYEGMHVEGTGCEFDMLCSEGGAFMRKLRDVRAGQHVDGAGTTGRGEQQQQRQDDEDEEEEEDGAVVGQGVSWHVVKGVRHAWDRAPFLSAQKLRAIERVYDDVLRSVKGLVEV